MPLISTRGVASAKGFGFTNLGSSNWIGILKAAGQASSGYGVWVDSLKNMHISGYNNNEGQIAKYNSSGIVQSQSRVVDASNGNQTVGIVTDSSNNVYYANKLYNGSTGFGSISVVKYDSSGVRQWTKRFINLNSTASLVGMTIDTSGNVYISVRWDNTAAYYIVAIKLNSSGVTQWKRQISSGSANVVLYTYGNMAVDASGNVYLSGLSWNTVGGGLGQEIFLIKLDSTGANVWQRLLGDSGTQQGWGTGVDSSGNVYVTGRNGSRVVLAKHNSSGTLQWQRELYNGGVAIEPNNMIVDANGNSYVFGYYRVSASAPELQNAFIVKYDTSGTIQWQRRLGTDIIGGVFTQTVAYNMAIDSDGVLYMIGYTSATGGSFFFAKLPPDGSKTGTYTLSGVTFYYAATSFTDSAGGFTSNTAAYSVGNSTFAEDSTNLTEATTSLVSTITNI